MHCTLVCDNLKPGFHIVGRVAEHACDDDASKEILKLSTYQLKIFLVKYENCNHVLAFLTTYVETRLKGWELERIFNSLKFHFFNSTLFSVENDITKITINDCSVTEFLYYICYAPVNCFWDGGEDGRPPGNWPGKGRDLTDNSSGGIDKPRWGYAYFFYAVPYY